MTVRAKYRIESDGTPYGTFVYDPDGNLMRGIQGLTYKVSFDGDRANTQLYVEATFEKTTEKEDSSS